MQNTKGKAIASLVCSIIGVVLAWFGWSAIASIVLGVVALVLGVKVRKCNDENKGMATAGLVLGIIAIVLGGIMTLCVISALCTLGMAGSAVNELSSLSDLSGLY